MPWDDCWRVFRFYQTGFTVFRYCEHLSVNVDDMVRDGWQFAGRVEMPGDE